MTDKYKVLLHKNFVEIVQKSGERTMLRISSIDCFTVKIMGMSGDSQLYKLTLYMNRYCEVMVLVKDTIDRVVKHIIEKE